MKKIIKYSVIAPINTGDVLISKSIELLFHNEFHNEFNIKSKDITFKKFDPKPKIKFSKGNLKTKKNIVLSFLYIIIKNFLFYLNDYSKVYNEIRNSDAVILGGGNILMESDGNDIFNKCYKICVICKKLNKPFAFYAVGLGPFEFGYQRRLRYILKNSVHFGVRDFGSQSICDEIFKGKSVMNFDPAILVSDYYPLKQEKHKYIGVNLMNLSKFIQKSENFSIQQIAMNLSKIAEHYKMSIKIINTSFGEDLTITELLKNEFYKLNNHHLISICNIIDEKDLNNAFCDVKFFLACRMHSSIFSQSYNIPTLVYPWHPKVYHLQKIIYDKELKTSLIENPNFDYCEIINKIELLNNQKLNHSIIDIKQKIKNQFIETIKFI